MSLSTRDLCHFCLRFGAVYSRCLILTRAIPRDTRKAKEAVNRACWQREPRFSTDLHTSCPFMIEFTIAALRMQLSYIFVYRFNVNG